MLLMIDNYDSFTYNLVQYFQKLGEEVLVYRNDKISLDEVEDINPDGIIISPGPCTPKEAGISVEIIRNFYKTKPIFGICLGHQSIGYAFGANIVKAKKLMHGKGSYIFHNKKDIFENIENPIYEIRYHSLVIDKETLPNELEITAVSIEDKILESNLKNKDIPPREITNRYQKHLWEIMGVKHKFYPTFGVQFHPESILSQKGLEICENFIRIVKTWKKKGKGNV